MKRKRIRIIAVILIGIMIINMFSGIPFVVKSAEAATGQMKDSRFQSTSYGVEDDRVIAHKLVLKDNESVIDLGIPDLLLVKQVIDKTRIQLHIYGVKGLIHTYELDADNEWVKRWEAAEDGHLDDLHSFARRLTFSKDHKHFDSELYKVMNPSTSDYDLINIENNKYYTFNADEVELIGLFDSMKNDTLDTKKKTDKISWVTYRVGKKYGIADTTGEKVTEAEYDEVGSKEKAVILTKEEVTEDGAINYKKTAVTVAGKLINLDNTREMAGPYYLKWTDDDEYSYINVETGQRIELGTYHGFYGAYGGSFVLLSQECDDLSSADSWTYLKWYILTTSGKIINLNDKLGVDAIDCDAFCFNQGVYSGWTDYLQVTGYRVLSRINGDAKTEYAFRGFIDGEGNVVFGYDTNEDLEWEPYWWSGDYGIIRKSTSVNDYYDYKVIDRQGHDIYQYTAKSVVAQNLQNEYIYLSQDDSVITLNVKSKKVISNVKLKFEDDGRYQTYTWTTEEGDFIKVEDMDGRLGIMNGKNQKIYWMAKDAEGKTDSTSDIYVYENDKEVGHKKTMILLYSNNEQVALDANMSRIKGIPQLKSVVDDHVYGGYIFHHSGVVYDFCGNIILKNAYASNPNGYSNVYVFWEGADKWSYDSLVTISKTENGSSCMFDEKAALKWSYFNIQTGQMMFDYDYRSVSDFYNGLACVYQQGEYSDRLKVINEDGNILVNLYLGEQELEGFAWHWYGVPKDAMYSNGVILQNSDYYFYDFSNVTSDDIGSQESIETCYDNDSNIRAEKVETPDEKFRFSGLDCDFTLPEEIPVIGGGQVKIDFSKLPVSIERSGNVIRIGFGILQTENDESQNLFDSKTWDKLKTSAEKMQSNATNGIDAFNDAKDFGCVSMPMSKKVKTNVTGYVEGTLKNGKFTDNVTGRFVFQISASVKKQWQTAIVSVPVVFSASGEVSGTASFAVGLDWDNAKITLEGDQSIELTLPKVKLSAGVGIAYVANVSVYGQCENILEITSSQDSTNKEDARIRDYIDGEIGVSASLLLASYEKTLIKAKRKVVYDSKNGMITSNMQNKMAAPDEEDYKIQRDYVSDMTGWQTDNKESSGETADIQILQQNVYNDAKPQIVCTDNGIKVMTFITDVPERTTGNHTAVAYSIYDDTTDTWSKPLLVEDDGTADMLPQLATDGKLSKEIPITNQDKYIKEPNGFYQDGEFYVVFTRSTADICDTEMMSSTDICTMHFKEYEDLKIDNLSVDEETVAPGQKGSLQVDVINQGLKEQKDFIIRVMNANEELGSYTYSELLPAGETKRIDIQFDIPEDFSVGTKISCVVEQKGDDNNTNNTLEQIVGKTNLSLDVIEKENAYDETEGILYVKNPSGYAANAVLKVYESGKNGKLLQKKSLGVIQPDEIQRIKYSSDELDDLAAKSGTLYFEVACDEEETFLSDNYGYVMAGQGSDDDDDWDVSPSPAASSTPNPVSTPLPSATASNKPTKRPASTPFKVALGYASADWSDSCFGINEAAVLVDGNGTFTVSHKATSDSTDIKVLTVDTDMLFSDMTNNATWKITQFSVGGKVYPIGTQYSTNDEHGNFRFELRNLYSALDRKDEMLGTQIIPVKKGDIISVSFTITGMTSEASNAGKPSETPKPTDKQNPTITPTNKPTVQPTKRPNHNKPVVKAPAKVRGVKVKNLKGRKMKVSWSWDITDGYQIQYAMNRKFTKKKKTVTLNSWMSKKTFKHLKKKKTYYVRVRAFRKSGSVKKYGKWSAVKKIKIKK